MTRQYPVQRRTILRMRPTLLAAALLAAGMHAHDASALGLGAIKTKSVIGEPFRAEVSLLGGSDSTPGSNCFFLDAPASAGQDDLPWLTNGRIRMQGRTLYISSPLAISEPILMIGLRVGCGFEVAREYAVLMQPAGSSVAEEKPAESLPAQGHTESPASAVTERRTSRKVREPASGTTTEGAPERPQAREARKPRRNESTAGRSSDRLSLTPTLDAGSGMKMSGGLAPRAEATEAQREALRTEQRLLAALDEQIATHLAISDKVKQLESRLLELQRQLGRTESSIDSALAPTRPTLPVPEISQAAPTPVAQPAAPDETVTETQTASQMQEEAETAQRTQEPAPAPPAGLTNEPVRVVNKLPPEQAPPAEPTSSAGLDWLVAAFGAFAAGSVLLGAWLWRRRSRKVAALSAIRSRQAEDVVARMMMEQPLSAPIPVGQTSRWTADEPEDEVAESTFAPYPAAEDATATTENFPGEAPAEQMAGICVDATPAAPVEVQLSATVESPDVDFEVGNSSDTSALYPTRLDLEFDSFVGSANALGPQDTNTASSGPRLVSSTNAPAAAPSFDQSVSPANEESAPSHEHVMELAEIMMSFGRAEGAAQTLSEFLRDYPKESLIPWLKLLDLYHSSGRRGEYDDLAPKLNRAFNVKVPEWEQFNGPITSESVEQFGHIMARINASWPNQDCLDYLTELLRDNRAGARVGFPLGVIDDILLLKAVLEWLIANPSITSTQVSRLALI